MELKICTININGFRSKRKQLGINQFITQNMIDILLIQETYVNSNYIAQQIETILNIKNKCLWSFGSSNSKGTAIFINNENIKVEKFHADFYGRLIYVDFCFENFKNFRLINVYCPNDTTERKDFFDSISPFLTCAKNVILAGDFNFVENTEMDKVGGNLEKGMVWSKSFRNIIDKYSLNDVFRKLYPNKKTMTWFRKNVNKPNSNENYNFIGVRLDRFYMSNNLISSAKSIIISPCSYSDHDYVIMSLNQSSLLTYGKSYWKLNDELLEDDDFISAFKFFWGIISRSKTISLEWWDKTKEIIKSFCIDYSKGKNKQLYGELKQLKKQYNSLNLKVESDIHIFNEIKEKIKVIDKHLLSGSIIRSKANILECNENPSRYFFQKEVNLAKKKTVHSIKCNNNIYTNSEDILTSFRSFYQNLYSEEPVDRSLNSLFLDNLPQVDISDNFILKQKIEKHEVFAALKAMKPNKSPGSDGLSSSFYLKFFDIFGDLLTELINLSYDQGSLSDSQKLSYITLICKDDAQSDDMKCYRPISLLNIDYKIISKIISTRLSNILPQLINADQTCSVKGRSIFDNLHLIRNVIDYIDQKNLPACFICLDQEKAFDRVSWSYMYDTLLAFGFDENFIKWIKLLYTDISSSVIVNNFISPSFSVRRGVRQGCSLSPLLYVLCFEPFAQKIRTLDEIKGLKLPGSKSELKLSIYADDSTGIFTTKSSMQKYFYWIDLFGRVSGSKINLGKSKGMYLGKWKDRSDHPFGISWIKSHKILGYFFGSGFSCDDVWSKIFLKFDRTLNLWKNRQLSFKGKSTVLNSLCLSKFLYYAAGNIVPSHYETLLQRSSFRFIWNSKYEPVARNTLYLDFYEGGLNVPNLKLKCHSLYLSHLQKLINNHEAKWTYFAKYWVGLYLRKLNPSLGSNSFPHSEYVPPFYKICLSVFNKLLDICPDFSFDTASSKVFYKVLISDICLVPKIQKICPTIDFKPIWRNIYQSFIDPSVRNIMFKLCHDVVFVNYYLFNKNISKDKKCPLCKNTETVSHLFLECSTFSPLNKIVLFLLRRTSNNKIKFSEKTFKYFELPPVEKYVKQLSLILLSESRHIIWTCRNLAKHENKNISSFQVVSKFLNKLKLRILADKKRLSFESFVELWCVTGGLCALDLTEDKIIFHRELDIRNYFQTQIVNT